MAYSFASASSQYLSAGTSVSAMPLTLACWARAPNTSGTHIFMSVGQASGTHRCQVYRNGTSIQADTVASGSPGVGALLAYSANTWFHVAAVFEASAKISLYVDGVLKTSGEFAAVTQNTLSETLIGARRGASVGVFYNGQIADAGVWSVALGNDDIASLAKGVPCRLVRPQSLAFYAPLIRELVDVRGGLTIANNNTATVIEHPRIYA